ncbi:cylicin-2 [Anolis carolinensis]|uniref:cylicin-2 n=1 Tax=Anolis carolinensis TaxID=28377 RepID=UPI002F2B5FEC
MGKYEGEVVRKPVRNGQAPWPPKQMVPVGEGQGRSWRPRSSSITKPQLFHLPLSLRGTTHTFHAMHEHKEGPQAPFPLEPAVDSSQISNRSPVPGEGLIQQGRQVSVGKGKQRHGVRILLAEQLGDVGHRGKGRSLYKEKTTLWIESFQKEEGASPRRRSKGRKEKEPLLEKEGTVEEAFAKGVRRRKPLQEGVAKEEAESLSKGRKERNKKEGAFPRRRSLCKKRREREKEEEAFGIVEEEPLQKRGSKRRRRKPFLEEEKAKDEVESLSKGRKGRNKKEGASPRRRQHCGRSLSKKGAKRVSKRRRRKPFQEEEEGTVEGTPPPTRLGWAPRLLPGCFCSSRVRER